MNTSWTRSSSLGLSLALGMLCASAASAQPTVYIPPGDYPRFGGEFELSQVGPVAGFWSTECRTWRIQAQEHRDGPAAAPALNMTLHRFIEGLIKQRPDYDDMSPAMAQAVRQNIGTYWPSLNRMGNATVAKRIGADPAGHDVYVLDLKGDASHWNLTINGEGRIEAAMMCRGGGI